MSVLQVCGSFEPMFSQYVTFNSQNRVERLLEANDMLFIRYPAGVLRIYKNIFEYKWCCFFSTIHLQQKPSTIMRFKLVNNTALHILKNGENGTFRFCFRAYNYSVSLSPHDQQVSKIFNILFHEYIVMGGLHILVHTYFNFYFIIIRNLHSQALYKCTTCKT